MGGLAGIGAASSAKSPTAREFFSPEQMRVLKSDPLALQRACWPWMRLADHQREMIHSVRDAKQTFVRSANMQGKDYAAAIIAVTFFMVPEAFFPEAHNRNAWANKNPSERWPRRRIITTSNTDKHLDVLWGEIGSLVTSSQVPLLKQHGGPLVMHNKEIRFASEVDAQSGNVASYLVGMVASEDAKFSGHHGAWCMVMGDEANALRDAVQTMCGMWAHREVWWGNPWPCTNFWYRGLRDGDLRVEDVGKGAA